ncbi:MAG: hypothetical protein VYC47_02955 [Verrucomicrobiota bacterium]|nr:hypothetical protein [Verrucomicrobiota bacterium]
MPSATTSCIGTDVAGSPPQPRSNAAAMTGYVGSNNGSTAAASLSSPYCSAK